MTELKKTPMARANFDAYLGHHLSFGNYLKTYHNAFNILLEDVDRTGHHIDRIAYPALFIARHCLELGFKANIRYFKKYSERENFTNSDSHNLNVLFGGFKLHVEMTIKNLKDKYGIEVEKEEVKAFNDLCSEVDKLTDLFNTLDNGSFSFRYPIDKQAKEVFAHTDRINLLDIKEALDKAMTLLYHTASVFSKYTDYADMIEKTYLEEMQNACGYY